MTYVEAVPYKIHKVLTDNGIQFTHHKGQNQVLMHIFESVCQEHQIEHRKTKIKHPWTNGQVERMNRTLKEATVQSFHYCSHEELKKHLHSYLMAYNFAKRLKAFKFCIVRLTVEKPTLKYFAISSWVLSGLKSKTLTRVNLSTSRVPILKLFVYR